MTKGSKLNHKTLSELRAEEEANKPLTQIKKIEVILKYFETGVRPKVKDLEGIFRVIDELPEKDYLSQYRAFLEFKQPLLQRTNIIDGSEKPKITF
jgi:hypothetical protein